MDESCCNTEQRSGGHPPCPACGRLGKRVPAETPGALVRPEAAGRVVAGVRYRFCATPGCEVAYYPEAAGAAAPIAASALRVAVGQKGMGEPRPLCYCFGFTDADVRGRAATGGEPVSAVVKRKMQEPGCACATQNPSGHCCLADIRTAEQRLAGAPDGQETPRPPALPRGNRPQEIAAIAGGQTGPGGVVGLLAMVPGIGAALLPAVACPACWAAYAGLLSSLGLGFIDYTPWLLPAMVAFLAIALATLAYQARRQRRYGPLLLGAAGGLALLAGRFALSSDAVLYAGIAALIAVSGWNAWPRSARACTLPAGPAGCGCKK